MTTSGERLTQNQGRIHVTRTRLLVLATALPYPPTNGYTLRVWALLQCLAAEGYETDLVCFGDPMEAERYREPLSRVCRTVEVVAHGEISLSDGLHIWRRLAALISGLPYAVVRSRSKAMETRISALLESGGVDAVLLEETNLLSNLPADPSIQLIIDHHNVEHLLLKRYVGHAKNWLRATYVWIETWKVRRWEKEACCRASVVLACSAHDRSAFLSFGTRAPVIVAPNVIDVDTYTPVYDDDGRTILYAGGMDWYPNRDAVEFFSKSILPWVQKSDSRVKFVIAGRGPSEQFRRKLEPIKGVEFTGTVADMRAEIARATICVVPLRIGSGTRLKILEAAAMGKAIVSTSLGAEGLDFIEGRHLVLADDPRDFAAAVEDLLRDGDRRRKLGRAARAWVKERYAFPTLRASLQALSTALVHEENVQ